MSPDTFRPIHPVQSRHAQHMAQLCADAFAGGKYVDQFRDNYIGNSHYDWMASRLILDGSRLLHHWGVWGYQMRLDGILLKVGGIGAVVTDEDHRKQGLMHRAAQASFEAMAGRGYDLSILRGRHYAKIGYVRAWNYVTYRLKPEEIPVLAEAGPYQPLGPDRVAEMDRLYNRTHAAFAGTAVRPTYRRRAAEDIGVHAWLDPEGKLAGYVRAMPDEDDPKVLHCLESAGDPARALAVLADLLARGGHATLACFTLPRDHPLLQRLRRGACTVEDRYFDISGWRVRLINLHSCLAKLIPVFEQRLAGSALSRWRGTLLLDAGEQQACLQIDRGRVQVGQARPCEHALHAGPALARLLIGSDEAGEIIRQADMDCRGQAFPLVQALFPNRNPMLSHWDEI